MGRVILPAVVALSVVVSLLGSSPPARAQGAGTETYLFFQGHPPLHYIRIGPLVDPKGKGKKFTGPATLILQDGTEVALTGKQKHNAKKLSDAYSFKSQKKTFPSVKLSLKTQGDPPVILKVTLKMKAADKTKTTVKEKAGAVTSEVRTRDPDRSDQLTREGVRSLIQGDDNFGAIATKLAEAAEADFLNPAPLLFGGIADFLGFLKQTGMESGGEFRGLYTDAGLANVGGLSLWQFALDVAPHADGNVKDTAPRTSEVLSFAWNTLTPEIETLIGVLEAVPADFEYRITTLDSEGLFFDGSLLDDTEKVWIDYGDAQMLRSMLSLFLSVLDYVSAFEWNDADPNQFDQVDNPILDPIDVIVNRYPNAGTIARPERFAASREKFEDAYEAYRAGALHILGETGEERDNGLVAPYRPVFRGRPTFDSILERDQFLTDEASFRTWMEEVIAQFDVDADYTFTTMPDGSIVPFEHRVTANLNRFWGGLDLRETYLMTIVDPSRGKGRMGVDSIDDLTEDAYTAGGILTGIRGREPGPGDLLTADDDGDGSNLFYLVRIDSVPVDAKSVDGSLADWSFGLDSVRIATSPSARLREPGLAFGDVHLSRDADNLYVGLTSALADTYALQLLFTDEHDRPMAGVFKNPGSPDGFAAGIVEDGDAAIGTGTEASLPLSNFPMGEWVKVVVYTAVREGRRFDEQFVRSTRVMIH